MTIVVALDLSPDSDEVLAEAVREARARRQPLMLLHAEPDPAVVPMVDGMPAEPILVDRSGEEMADAVELSSRWAEPLRDQGLEVTTRLVEGDPGRVILDVAREKGADLIVLGCHQRKGLWRLLAPSVAQAVVRHSPCPVLVVPVGIPT